MMTTEASPGDGGNLTLSSGDELTQEYQKTSFKRGWRFYTILISIACTGLLTALEATITSTALPSIVSDLGGGDVFVWVANGYFLAMSATQTRTALPDVPF